MQNRRHPAYSRKYIYNDREPDPRTAAVNPVHDTIKLTAHIPLPNEEEDTAERSTDLRYGQKPSILDFIRTHVTIEEIILVGLILLMFDEGIQDEFLLLILVYVLLT